MHEDEQNQETRRGFCPSVRHLPLGQVAIWGLLINAAYQLITTLGLLVLFGIIGVSLGNLGLSYSTSSSDRLTIIILTIIGTLVPALSLLLPVASAASAVATSIGLYRGGRVVTLYLGAVGAVLGPACLAALAMLSVIGMGWIGSIAGALGFTIMALLIVVSAVAEIGRASCRERV